MLASGRRFGRSESTNFCIETEGGTPPTPATCSDGIQNGDETGVDCGGSNCPECSSCPTPTGLKVEYYYGGFITKLVWDDVSAARRYDIEVRKEGRSNWRRYSTRRNGAYLRYIRKGNKYEWRVRSYCGRGEYSDWSEIQMVSPGSNNRQLFEKEDIHVYPNPASSIIYGNINYFETNGEELMLFEEIENHKAMVTVTLLDLMGRQIEQKKLGLDESQFQFNVQNLSSGIYLIQVRTEDGLIQTKKIAVQQN